MTRVFAVFAALCMSVLLAGQAPRPQMVEYQLRPVLERGALTSIAIELRFRGEPDGETVLQLPNSWGGEDELWRGVADLRVDGAAMREGDDPAVRVLSHRPNARIRVRYRIVQDWEGEPSAGAGRRNPYRPIVQPGYFHLIGNAALIAPQIDGANPVRLRVRGLPRGWSFASDLEHEGLSLARVHASVTVGGDYRVRRGADENVRVAMRGAWGFSDEDFTAQVSEIIAGQRRFWGDDSTPYLVTVTHLAQAQEGWLSIGGTGLDDAFAFFATPNAEARMITRTLAHEGLHSWIPGRIGGMPEQDEAADYWLSEGFTDFFTGRVLVREALWGPEQFAADLNDMLRAYASSPARAEPNTRVVADFWNDQAVSQLPYQRGRLLATLWDARLRESGRDLDDAVLEMRDRARMGDPLNAAAMFPLVMDRFGADVRAEIETHIERGAPILLPENAFGACGRVETRTVANFHRGFDVEATLANGAIISGVDPELPAYAAGMRDGMVLLRRDEGEVGNAEREIVYVVRDGETERAFRYWPRGRGAFELQQLVLADGLEGEARARCLAVLGGA